MKSITFKIHGMRCDGCAERLRTRFERTSGVRDAEVSFADAEARIAFNPHAVDEQTLTAVIEAAGFGIIRPKP